MNKKLVALCLCVAILASALTAGTLAWLTDVEAPIENVFTVGEVDITLTEDFDEETAVLVPGTEIDKAVWVENTGTEDAYARVIVAFQHSEDNSTSVKGGLAAKLEVKHTPTSIYEWYDEPDHIKLADGNWYSIVSFTHNGILAPEEKVATLATVGLQKDVTYDDLIAWGICNETEDGYALENIKVHVAAQGVQAANIDATDKDTTGEGKGKKIDEILDEAFGSIEDYTADDLNALFGITAE